MSRKVEGGGGLIVQRDCQSAQRLEASEHSIEGRKSKRDLAESVRRDQRPISEARADIWYEAIGVLGGEGCRRHYRDSGNDQNVVE